ncbi:hypothetical protein [Phormidium sp. CCY1219]|nr:hypothetical protein [Phormidium sp. CCY1219]
MRELVGSDRHPKLAQRRSDIGGDRYFLLPIPASRLLHLGK